ncbi:MAG: chemotaxis response regulator protein-glutamate methylesterase [Thermoplasmata archaeon]
MPGQVRAVIVDDSAYMRVVLKDMLETDPEISVVGVAKDGLEAVDTVKRLTPDVVLLDIQMPRMDGLATLQRIMKENPTRVVMLSAMDKKDDQLPLRALGLGAVDFISKPSGPVSIDIVNFSERIIEIVKGAAGAKLDALQAVRASAPRRISYIRRRAARSNKSVFIAASTGGPRALEAIFSALPKDLPASIFIVQHIPENFSESFAKRLASVNGPRVTLAHDSLPVDQGTAYLAPGGRHMKVGWMNESKLQIVLDDSEPVNFVKPSADVLFASAAETLGEHALGVVLTGMGMDGARGAAVLHMAGGRVIAQDEKTSIVFGMPRAVIDAGIADEVLPLTDIPEAIVRFLED